MKLIIEPTGPNRTPPFNVRVEITSPSDDLNFEEVWEMLRGAVLAWGFSPITVAEYFDEE